MWINRDVDLPQALIAAQREGRLVIFAGAGVSMGPPADLPSFEDLAVQIAGGASRSSREARAKAWLGGRDSNPDNRVQSAVSYR